MEPYASSLPLRTVGDLRAALRAGHGFPGDPDAFEADLRRALESSPATGLTGVDSVIVDYRGRIRLRQDPDFDASVQEGIDLAMRLKRKARRE